MKKFEIPILRLVLTIILTFSGIARFHAQEMVVPIKLQLALFFKILPFDRNLKDRVGDEIVIAVFYQNKIGMSYDAKEELLKMVKESSVKKIEGIPLRFVSIDIEETDLKEAITRDNVDILYITPLRAVEIEKIANLSRAKKITTLTGVPDYVESGLAVGVGIKGEKPQIIINLKAAKAEGADFSANLLKLCRVIKEDLKKI